MLKWSIRILGVTMALCSCILGVAILQESDSVYVADTNFSFTLDTQGSQLSKTKLVSQLDDFADQRNLFIAKKSAGRNDAGVDLVWFGSRPRGSYSGQLSTTEDNG